MADEDWVNQEQPRSCYKCQHCDVVCKPGKPYTYHCELDGHLIKNLKLETCRKFKPYSINCYLDKMGWHRKEMVL